MALTLAIGFGTAHAQPDSCVPIQDDVQRLACYDSVHGRPAAGKDPAAASAGSRLLEPALALPVTAPVASALERRWELRPDLEQGTFKLLPHQPIYALLHATSSTHNRPSSPSRPPPAGAIDLNHVEAKLQFSFKSKVWQNIGGSPADLWLAYTQQSYWQVGNSRQSSLFRETDYRPEAILVHPLQADLGSIRLRAVGLSLTHESNGRGEPLSRSWNRLIGDLAFEAGPWELHVRPWARIDRNSGSREDNADIQDYVGRGELVAVYRANRHVVTLAGRHTLKGGDKSRGGVRADWAFPLVGGLNGHLQLGSGYGENLIDYNHRQTTIGLGVSFFD
jgi:phospholipase A1